MGNYYAGMINNTGGYGELKHHGILGQKWGVRRFQNADGSLTAAGRERYGSSSVSDKDLKKLSKMIAARPRNTEAIKNLPFIQNAAKQLREEGKKAAEASNEFDSVRDELDNYIFNNEKRYEKWLNKAVDNYMRDENPDESMGNREDIYNWFKYDDGDQNERGTVETYLRESKEPMAKKYLDAEKKSTSAYSELRKKADSIANDILGDGPDTNMDKFWTSVFIQDAAKEYDSKHSPETNEKYANKLHKDFENYQDYIQGTKSLFGGDHTNDKSSMDIPKTGMANSSYSLDDKERFIKENFGYVYDNDKWAYNYSTERYLSKHGKIPDWDTIDIDVDNIEDKAVSLIKRKEKADSYRNKIISDSYKMDDDKIYDSRKAPKNWVDHIDDIANKANDDSGNTKYYNKRKELEKAYKSVKNIFKKAKISKELETARKNEKDSEQLSELLFLETIQKEIAKLPKDQQATAKYLVAVTFYD